MSVSTKEFIRSGQKLQDTAQIIDLEQKRVDKVLKDLGMTAEEFSELAEGLDNLVNVSLVRTLGGVKLSPQEKAEATHEKEIKPKISDPRTPSPEKPEISDKRIDDNSQEIENHAEKPHNKDMSEIPTHIYIDKSIASLEKTMSDNLLRMETIVASAVEANKVANDNLKEKLDESIKDVKGNVAEIKNSNADTRKYISNLKLQALGLAVATVIGMAGLNYALVQNVTGSFALGQSSTEVVKNEVANQINPLVAKISQSDAKIDKMNETLNRLISAPAATPNFYPSPSQSPTPEPLRLYK